MKNPITDQIVNHLECLGYKIEELKGIEEKDVILATHEQRANIVFDITKSNTVLMGARYTISEPNVTANQEFMNQLNVVNSRTVFTKWYYDENKEKRISMKIETFAIGYDKHVFGTLLEVIERDIFENMSKLQEALKIS